MHTVNSVFSGILTVAESLVTNISKDQPQQLGEWLTMKQQLTDCLLDEGNDRPGAEDIFHEAEIDFERLGSYIRRNLMSDIKGTVISPDIRISDTVTQISHQCASGYPGVSQDLELKEYIRHITALSVYVTVSFYQSSHPDGFLSVVHALHTALDTLFRRADLNRKTLLDLLSGLAREFPAKIRSASGTDEPEKNSLPNFGRSSELNAEKVLHPVPGVSLEGLDLSGANLRGADLRGLHLENVNLQEAHLEGAHLEGAHLNNAVLNEAVLDGAFLDDAWLEFAQMNHVSLNGASLQRTHLREASLILAHLSNADLSGADLQMTSLMMACLKGASLAGASLATANLWNADFRESCLEEANLCEVILTMSDLKGANLRKANLQEANLDKAQLDGADLTAANLDSACLNWTVLKGACLKRANLRSTELQNTFLEKADLREARMEDARIDRCSFSTTLITEGALETTVHFTGPVPDGVILCPAHEKQ